MKERKLEEVKIKIIREVNENPESKDLSITEKKVLIERRMSKARKNKENKKNDHSTHKECKGNFLRFIIDEFRQQYLPDKERFKAVVNHNEI